MDFLPTAKSLQAHIGSAPNLSPIQWRIWGLATMGKLFEGAVVFLTGVAIPLVEKDFNLSTTLKGSVTAATLFGILVGASLFGAPLFICTTGRLSRWNAHPNGYATQAIENQSRGLRPCDLFLEVPLIGCTTFW